MIELFEPFQAKLQLHIDEGFLQRLWDKYVPASAESYERISLIYLNGPVLPDREPSRQIQILVNIALNNLFLQMNMKQSRMLVCRQALDRSLRYSMKYYLEQLKRSDFQVFQSLNQFVTYLEKEEEKNRQYRRWQKENRIIEQFKHEYRVLQDFSMEMKKLSIGRLAQTERKICKDIFWSLGKKEYKSLAESFIWREKESLKNYIRFSDEEQYQQILKRLTKVTELHDILTTQVKSVQEIESAAEAEDAQKAERAIEAERAQKAERAIENISREQLLSSLEILDQKDLRKFYQKVVFFSKEPRKREEQLFYTGVIWERTKKEMIWQLNQMDGEAVHHFFKKLGVFTESVCEMEEARLKESRTETQKENGQIHYHICRRFSASLREARETYFSEIKESLKTQVINTLKQEKYSVIANTLDDKLFFHDIGQIYEKLEQKLQEQKNRIIERETRAFKSYQDILPADDFAVSQRIEAATAVQYKAILNRNEDISVQNESRKERPELSEMLEWGEALLAHPKYEQQEEDAADIGEKSQRTEEPHTQGTGEEEKEAAGSGQEAQAEIIRRKIAAAKDRAKLQSLIEQISHYVKEDAFHPAYQEGQLKNPSIRRLLRHMDKLSEEQYRTFVRELSDLMVLKWRRMREDHQEEVRTESISVQDEAILNRNEDISVWNTSILNRNETTKARAELSEMLEWGEALLVHPRYGRQEEDAEGIGENSQRAGQETQAEIIRRQIQVAKDRAKLQSLIEQLSYQVKEDTFHPTYQEGQLKNPSIRRLLRHMDKLSEEQYRTFVRELSDLMVLRWRRMREDHQEEVRTESGSHSMETEKDREELQKLIWKRREAQGISAYQELAYRIQAYEERRQKEYARRIRQFEAKHFVRETLSLHEDTVTDRALFAPLINLQKSLDSQGDQEEQVYQNNPNLRYTVASEPLQNRQMKPDIQKQEDTIQLKSVQEQLSARIKEVENKLRQTENKAGIREVPGEIAEKVKRQLHEELHLERLRRGMV